MPDQKAVNITTTIVQNMTLKEHERRHSKTRPSTTIFSAERGGVIKMMMMMCNDLMCT